MKRRFTYTQRLTFGVYLSLIAMMLLVSCDAPYRNPPATLENRDLVGLWEVKYGDVAIDQIQLTEDNFVQHYQRLDAPKQEYMFSGDGWWIERLADGLQRLHLKGGKYLQLGEVLSTTPSMYDPFATEWISTDDELVLEIRAMESGELVLYHLKLDMDDGFSIFGGDRNFFRRGAGNEH